MAVRERNAAQETIRQRNGQTLAEYALILTFIALACVAGVTLMGSSISGFFNSFGGGY